MLVFRNVLPGTIYIYMVQDFCFFHTVRQLAFVVLNKDIHIYLVCCIVKNTLGVFCQAFNLLYLIPRFFREMPEIDFICESLSSATIKISN